MSFLNPLFLIGLLAVAAPIIVHLVRRTRAPRVEFPSLMFVRKIPQRTIRRRRLQNLLLLLLRTLAFLFLVLAFVRPYFGSGQAETAGRRATAILLDTSFSMRYGNRFEQALDRVRAAIDLAAGNERLALITFGQSYDIQSRFTEDKAKLKSLVSNLKPGATVTDYAQALRGAEGIFKDAQSADKRIILVTDFQAAGQNPGETTFRLSGDIKLETIDIGEEKSPNLAITEVRALPIIYQPKYADKLTARIHNFSDEPEEGVRVEFQLNERTVEKREINIPPRQSTIVEFTGFNLIEGPNRGLIQLEGDEFPFDNRFFFNLRRNVQMKALVLETATRGRSESFYLRNALTTGDNLPFAVEVKTAGSINPTELGQYRVIILNDPGTLSQALAAQLGKFVEGGGGLIIAAGPHADPPEFNRSFADLSPAKIEEAVNLRGNYVAMSEVKTEHPIFEVFRQSGRLSAARVFGYHRVTADVKSAVLARYEDGNPALIESARGGGKVLLFTSTLDSAWNDLPLTPSYLPLIRQMTRYLGESDLAAWRLVGQAFGVPADKDGEIPAIDTPAGARIKEQKQDSTGELVINPLEAGFYRLRYPNATDFAAVNIDSKESDLTRLKVTDFVASVTGADNSNNAAAAAATTEKLSNEEIESRQRIWWTMLILALALFVAEAVLSRRTKTARVIN